MKKIAPIAVALLIVAGMTSCKKEYTCTCTTSYTGGPSTTVSGKTAKMKKKDAEASCNTGDRTYTVGTVTYTVACNID